MNSIPHNRKYLSFILSFILVLSMLFSAGCSKKDNTADKENTGGTFVEKTTEEPDTKSTQADAAAVSSLFNFSL
jgi:ABC-type oligopeptide transport system substrate-binding subunit